MLNSKLFLNVNFLKPSEMGQVYVGNRQVSFESNFEMILITEILVNIKTFDLNIEF